MLTVIATWISPAARLLIAPVAAVICVLALAPSGAEMPTVLSWQVTNHLMAFATVTGLLVVGWPGLKNLVAVMSAFAFGVVIEAGQWALTDDRVPSMFDLGVNLVGILIGLITARGLLRVIGGPDR